MGERDFIEEKKFTKNFFLYFFTKITKKNLVTFF